ncbi:MULTISPECIES: glycine zipper 2TM domain-containing protein [Massilia]|jgi:uncharacterized protein YcfJ|uniref:glycine zipper 2TM domain-containing protein n=1 Tax=Massilia TaxID=149698 RepID=UPI0004E34526|nr:MULTISPECIES: glycine zipper 2TM domain-containing protein [Massilia]KFC72604.1 Surface antigen [Massilia sp. LC238]
MKNVFSLAFLFVVAAAASFSAHAKDVLANITNVVPVYAERVQNQQVCDMVYNDQPQQVGAVNSGSVIGGIAGALLGSQAGGGNGKLALTALGAVTGAMTGDRLAQQRSAQPQQVCRWVQRSEQHISSYRVTYEYQGDTFVSNLPYDPSRGGAVKTVPVQMSLSLR